MKRCAWVTGDPEYLRYHDEIWGVPVHEDTKLFEFIVLEGAQAGLSWLTILKKQAGYQQAFEGFIPEKVAGFTEDKIQELIRNGGIVRNQLKIRSAVTNAAAFVKIQEVFGSFDHYAWGFVDGSPVVNTFRNQADVPATTDISDAFSKDLRQRGFKFTGSTIVYAYMQAVGMVNDHLVSCFRHKEVMAHY